MKATFFKNSLWLVGILLTSISVKAQNDSSVKKANDIADQIISQKIYRQGGKFTETLETEIKGRIYRTEWANEKMTSLAVDGKRIPQAEWNKYNETIGIIREGRKAQAKRDLTQRARNKDQAKRNAEQAVRNQQQAKRNAEQIRRNEIQVKQNVEQEVRNEQQVKRNAEQEVRNEQQVKRNAEQAIRNEQQVKRNAEQSILNEQQAKVNAEQAFENESQQKRNLEQAQLNAIQAEKNQAQAKAMEQLMKEIAIDLANDKIIKDPNDLRQLTITPDGMTVNGIKQSEDVFKKYREKYNKEKYGILGDGFNYNR